MNGAGRFLFCFVVAEEEKRFSLVFPKGTGFHGGWSVLVEKLRSLGVAPSSEVRRVGSPAKVRSISRETTLGSFADVIRKAHGVASETVWV